MRWSKIGLYSDSKHWSEGSPVILAFWHGDQLLMPWCYFSPRSPEKRSIKALVSLHSDGRIASEALRRMSIECIDGSSSRGGARALVLMKKELALNNHVAITPDGPKGPRHTAKVGAAKLSSMTGVPILPIAMASNRFWKLRSWDGMFIPKPFCHSAMVLGERIEVPQGLSREELGDYSQRIEVSLNTLKDQAQELCESSSSKCD